MNVFYYFVSQLKISYFHAYLIEIDCEEKLARGEYEGIDFPLTFKQSGGKKIHDIIDGGYAGLYLISDRMKLILEASQLTGWQTYPIKLYDKKSEEIHGYHGFSIIGRCSPINYKNSEIIEKRLVPTGPICKFYKGIFFENWDGSDFFSPAKTTKILISEKAAITLQKNKITNLQLINLIDYEVYFDYVKN